MDTILIYAIIGGIVGGLVGIINEKKMKKQMEMSHQNSYINDMSSLLRADDKKGRILIAVNYEDMQISMKRTRGLTELIVNGNVYDEVKGTVEFGYTLTANLNGKKIVGMCNSVTAHMYIFVNDVLIKKKLRLF